MIDSLEKLYEAFEQLYGDMRLICSKCTFHICEGYLWVLPEEESRLQSNGAMIIEVSGPFGPCSLVNPLDSIEPKDFERMKPKCPLFNQNGLCSIHVVRPLVCRMYPAGLLVIKDKVHIVLGQDCQYVYEADNDTCSALKVGIFNIFSSCSPELRKTILDTYVTFNCYLKYPEGPNRYVDIGEFPI